jgi:hypothetical protein
MFAALPIKVFAVTFPGVPIPEETYRSVSKLKLALAAPKLIFFVWYMLPKDICASPPPLYKSYKPKFILLALKSTDVCVESPNS